MATNPKNTIRRDDFVKKLRPNPKFTDEFIRLKGYVGDSSEKGRIYLYLDSSLNNSIEINEEEIEFHQPVDKSEDPLGGTRVWLKKTAQFTTGNPNHINRVKSTFLEGDLIKAFGNLGVKIPRVIGKAADIPSEFIETGCGPITEIFDDCAPTGANNPLCQIFEPPNDTLPTDCGKQTCLQPSCAITCDFRYPFKICWAHTLVCEVYTPRFQPLPRTANYTGGFNPYKQ